MLPPELIVFTKSVIDSVTTAVLDVHDPRIDEMMPECAMFIPNLMAEFKENPKLAMIHGDGTCHAWFDVQKLREVLATKGDQIKDYRSLFRAFTERGYDVKKIEYIYFRSSFSPR